MAFYRNIDKQITRYYAIRDNLDLLEVESIDFAKSLPFEIKGVVQTDLFDTTQDDFGRGYFHHYDYVFYNADGNLEHFALGKWKITEIQEDKGYWQAIRYGVRDPMGIVRSFYFKHENGYEFCAGIEGVKKFIKLKFAQFAQLGSWNEVDLLNEVKMLKKENESLLKKIEALNEKLKS